MAKIPKTKIDLELFDPFAPMCRHTSICHFSSISRSSTRFESNGRKTDLVLHALANSLVLGSCCLRISSSGFARETHWQQA